MLKSRTMVENPDDIVMTIKLTTTMKEFGELRDQLENVWPSSRLSNVITEMFRDAHKVFYASDEED